jgi:hypothetical protein
MRSGVVKMEHPPCGTCTTPAVLALGKRLEFLFTEVATVELFPGFEPVDEDGAVDTSEDCEHRSWAGYHLRDSCGDLICRYAPCLRVISVLQKPGLLTGSRLAVSFELGVMVL